ncbi:MAG TPA: response regulator [Anaerolineae bacterium]|nr:response regulator [Anaerolineae bacterium]
MPKALVIDDEAALTAVIARQLKSAGFEVETATSGSEGLARARSVIPDVVIVDVMMPNMDGYEVCRRLRRDPRTSRAAIVVLTARGQLVDKQIALRAGADAHMPKPYKGHDLLETIETVLAGRATSGQRAGQQVVVLRLTEGAGATTVAVNLAACLRGSQGMPVAIVDTVLRRGQVEYRLGLPAMWEWAEGDAKDPDVVAGRMVRHESGLWVLPAPPANVPQPVADDVASMLRIVSKWYDYVVVDTPFHLGSLAPVLIRSAHLVLLVLEPEVGVLRSAPASISAIQKLAGRSLSVWPVVNKAVAGGEVLRQQLEQALRQPVMAMLPSDPAASAEALMTGCPVVLGAPDSRLAAGLRELAGSVQKMFAAHPLRRIPTT